MNELNCPSDATPPHPLRSRFVVVTTMESLPALESKYPLVSLSLQVESHLTSEILLRSVYDSLSSLLGHLPSHTSLRFPVSFFDPISSSSVMTSPCILLPEGAIFDTQSAVNLHDYLRRSGTDTVSDPRGPKPVDLASLGIIPHVSLKRDIFEFAIQLTGKIASKQRDGCTISDLKRETTTHLTAAISRHADLTSPAVLQQLKSVFPDAALSAEADATQMVESIVSSLIADLLDPSPSTRLRSLFNSSLLHSFMEVQTFLANYRKISTSQVNDPERHQSPHLGFFALHCSGKKNTERVDTEDGQPQENDAAMNLIHTNERFGRMQILGAYVSELANCFEVDTSSGPPPVIPLDTIICLQKLPVLSQHVGWERIDEPTKTSPHERNSPLANNLKPPHLGLQDGTFSSEGIGSGLHNVVLGTSSYDAATGEFSDHVAPITPFSTRGGFTRSGTSPTRTQNVSAVVGASSSPLSSAAPKVASQYRRKFFITAIVERPTASFSSSTPSRNHPAPHHATEPNSFLRPFADGTLSISNPGIVALSSFLKGNSLASNLTSSISPHCTREDDAQISKYLLNIESSIATPPILSSSQKKTAIAHSDTSHLSLMLYCGLLRNTIYLLGREYSPRLKTTLPPITRPSTIDRPSSLREAATTSSPLADGPTTDALPQTTSRALDYPSQDAVGDVSAPLNSQQPTISDDDDGDPSSYYDKLRAQYEKNKQLVIINTAPTATPPSAPQKKSISKSLFQRKYYTKPVDGTFVAMRSHNKDTAVEPHILQRPKKSHIKELEDAGFIPSLPTGDNDCELGQSATDEQTVKKPQWLPRPPHCQVYHVNNTHVLNMKTTTLKLDLSTLQALKQKEEISTARHSKSKKSPRFGQTLYTPHKQDDMVADAITKRSNHAYPSADPSSWRTLIHPPNHESQKPMTDQEERRRNLAKMLLAKQQLMCNRLSDSEEPVIPFTAEEELMEREKFSKKLGMTQEQQNVAIGSQFAVEMFLGDETYWRDLKYSKDSDAMVERHRQWRSRLASNKQQEHTLSLLSPAQTSGRFGTSASILTMPEDKDEDQLFDRWKVFTVASGRLEPQHQHSELPLDDLRKRIELDEHNKKAARLGKETDLKRLLGESVNLDLFLGEKPSTPIPLPRKSQPTLGDFITGVASSPISARIGHVDHSISTKDSRPTYETHPISASTHQVPRWLKPDHAPMPDDFEAIANNTASKTTASLFLPNSTQTSRSKIEQPPSHLQPFDSLTGVSPSTQGFGSSIRHFHNTKPEDWSPTDIASAGDAFRSARSKQHSISAPSSDKTRKDCIIPQLCGDVIENSKKISQMKRRIFAKNYKQVLDSSAPDFTQKRAKEQLEKEIVAEALSYT